MSSMMITIGKLGSGRENHVLDDKEYQCMDEVLHVYETLLAATAFVKVLILKSLVSYLWYDLYKYCKLFADAETKQDF